MVMTVGVRGQQRSRNRNTKKRLNPTEIIYMVKMYIFDTRFWFRFTGGGGANIGITMNTITRERNGSHSG